VGKAIVAIILAAAAAAWAWCGPAAAGGADGKAVFQELNCTSCHKEAGKGVGSSVAEIAEAYAGKAQRLRDYLAGQAEAMMKPSKAAIMRRQIAKTKELSAAERQALADYLLGKQ
jgi:cytochrome c551/c552